MKRRSALPLRVHSALPSVDPALLQRRLRRAATLFDHRLIALDVILVGDAAMRKLHMQFMQLDTTTDVLTFPLELDARGRAISGEVYVCVPEARRRARQLGTRLPDELLLYGLHGMLHLAGLDDRTDRAYARMHRTEDQILRQLGIGPVFDPASRK